MKILLFSVVLAFIMLSCAEPQKPDVIQPRSKNVEVKIHKTIETFMILRALADNDPLFQYRDANYKSKPIMYEARQFFAAYKNHPAVEETQLMLNATSSTGDLILQGLLYYEELPSNQLKFTITSPDWKNRQDSLSAYMNTLQNFFREAEVDLFLQNHAHFYKGAISEANAYLDTNLIPTLEEYFGMENEAYQMILIPNSPFGMGFGASTTSEVGNTFYQIISPANDEEWDSTGVYHSYGFSGDGATEYYRDMVVHEFCHPFITPFLEQEKWKVKIEETDSLFVPSLDSLMSKQGYGSWWSFVNEHIVRLGEIRVAKAMKIQSLDKMRTYNINENGFVLIPEAEKIIVEYENNRNTYKDFQMFIPVLIDQLNSFNKKQMEEKVQQIVKGEY